MVKSNGSDSLTVALLSRATRANRSHSSSKKSNWSNSLLGRKRGKSVKKNCQKHMKKMIFFSELLVLESDLLKLWANHSHHSFLQSYKSIFSRSPFCHERPERIAHGRSFVKSDESNCLTVAPFKERWEQIAHSRAIIWVILSKKQQREKETIPNPA